MNTEDVYRKLAETTIPPEPDSEIFLKILSVIMSPEEAEFLLALPASKEDLAAKFNLAEDAIERKIHDLMKRGLVFPFEKGPSFINQVGLLMDETMSSSPENVPTGLGRLWKEHVEVKGGKDAGDWLASLDPPLCRVVPARKAVPKDVELLPWEDINQIIRAARSSTVRNCPCRLWAQGCDAPIHTCAQFNKRADYHVLRGAGKPLTAEEMIAGAESCADAALVAVVANIANLETQEYICYCCGCCCIMLGPLKRANQLSAGLAKSRFRAEVDKETCTGCQKCVKRCHFDAITMENVPG